MFVNSHFFCGKDDNAYLKSDMTKFYKEMAEPSYKIKDVGPFSTSGGPDAEASRAHAKLSLLTLLFAARARWTFSLAAPLLAEASSGSGWTLPGCFPLPRSCTPLPTRPSSCP